MAVNDDYGIDPPLVNLTITQATSPDVPAGVNNGTNDAADVTAFADIGTAPPKALMNPGVGEHPDASQSNTSTSTATAVNSNSANDKIVAKPNVLDTFSSYTYRASVYMVSPAQYKSLITSKKKTVNGYQLLFQSGGAPNNVGGFQGGLSQGAGATAASLRAAEATETEIASVLARGIPSSNAADAGRNPAFPLDFYIDSVTIENLLSGRGSRAAHAVSNLKFTVIEPLGITLIDRIYQAVQDFIPKNGAGAVNYNSVSYLMVIRFYGYDSQGNLVPGIRGADASTGLSDPNSVIEKFIPFRISKLNWSISDKLVTYEFEGKAFNMMVAAGTRRGTIPHDVQLNSGTLGDLLGADAEYSTQQNAPGAAGAPSTVKAINPETGQTYDKLVTPAPSKANAAPNAKKTIKKGLMGAMSDYSKEDCTGPNARFNIPDTYKVVWIPDTDGKQTIRDATIVLPGKIKEGAQTSMSPGTNKSAQSADPNRSAKDTTTRNFSITAGMQIVQAIDLAIRNSSYIINQQLVVINPLTGKEEPNKEKFGQPVKWYNILFEAVPKDYDETRNDNAFDITFYIVPFIIEQYDSRYFPVTRFRGVHKSYNIYFTGKNTGVLDYREELNSLYNITVSGSDPKNSQAEKQRRAIYATQRDMPFYTSQSASTESRQGTEGDGLETVANIAESFYSAADLAKTSLKIIGDPAWLQQGSFAGGIDATAFSYSPFLSDGTINFDAMQILFEVNWQRPEDYDLNSGLADPYNRATAQAGQPGASRLYVAKKCISEFRQGKFEQTIEGSLFTLPKPSATNKAATAAVTSGLVTDENQSAAETARLQRQSDVLGRQNAGSPGDTSTDQGTQSSDGTGGAQYSGAADTTARPAPTVAQPSSSENTTPAAAQPAPNLQPQTPAKPPTSNGLVAAINKFLPPSVGGRGRIAVPNNPQLLARDE